AAPQEISDDAKYTEGEGEEFSNDLAFTVEIYTDFEAPEPFRRARNLPGMRDVLVSETPARPSVTLTSQALPAPGQGQPGALPMGRSERAPIRLVIPRHFTEPGAAPTEQPQPERTPDPVTIATGSPAPGALELDLGQRLQTVAFGGLERVAAWTPTATL